ncbi:S8 family serine peptidase [Aestuariibaculum suncheonense]|uniref:S8 family serine peptidase n=1 Tax=Aestuariibaculum suncheonense TaxID=1028745 RepID=A0A8J6QFQ6_9FLAO|nr:S8 family serine peptidase [Aestuariibaculum suncheonense]MBD0835893.1 S8 family serine peptidase [Aestuariibaculum suncheonense]
MKNHLLFFLLFGYSFTVWAQQDAWVYLTDKGTTYNVSTPSGFLTQKAIDRKVRHGVIIDERDIPVNEAYISQIKIATGITVMAKSKWFNAVHVRGSQADILNLKSNYTFVDYIDFANKSLNTSKIAKPKEISKLESLATAFEYGTSENQVSMINANDLHLADYSGTGMTIAVMDAGYPGVNSIGGFQRLRDANGILGTYDFVNRDVDVYTNTTSNHGTLVLSTMAGYIENQYVGTAPDASYYLFITEDGPNENPVEESYWVEAAERADSLGVDVINTSLGYGAFYDNLNYNYSAAEYDGKSIYITKGANIAFEKGLLLINSAGNEGTNGVNAPADSPNVFSIGAVDASGNYASFSSVGSPVQPTQKPDVVAQGLGSAVITENNTLASVNGTSFSSPVLAGGITCLWQALYDKTNAEIMKLVRESASQYSMPDYQLGYGIPNLFAALNNVLSLHKDEINSIQVFPNPVKDLVHFQLPDSTQNYAVSFYDVLGKLIKQTSVSSEDNQVDLSSLSKGLYVLKINGATQIITLKIIKQ